MGLRVQRVAVGIGAAVVGFALWGLFVASADRLTRAELPLGMPGWMVLLLGLCFVVGGGAHAYRGLVDED